MRDDYSKIKNYVSSLFFGTWMLAFIVGFIASIAILDSGYIGYYIGCAFLWIPYFITKHFVMKEFKELLEELEYYR